MQRNRSLLFEVDLSDFVVLSKEYAIFSKLNQVTCDAGDGLQSSVQMMFVARARSGKKRQKVLRVQFLRQEIFSVKASISTLK